MDFRDFEGKRAKFIADLSSDSSPIHRHLLLLIRKHRASRVTEGGAEALAKRAEGERVARPDTEKELLDEAKKPMGLYWAA
jgi:hypothetical protein